MKTMLRMGAIALVIALATRVPAQAAPVWVIDIPIDVTAFTKGGYPASALGLFLQCHVFAASNPSLEVGSGYAKHVPVAPSGITRVRVVAKPNIHAQDNVAGTYTCYAGVGPIDEDFVDKTTGYIGSGPLTAPPLPTQGAPMVLKPVTSATPKPATPKPLGAGPPHPSGPVTSPPKGAPPPNPPAL